MCTICGGEPDPDKRWDSEELTLCDDNCLAQWVLETTANGNIVEISME